MRRSTRPLDTARASMWFGPVVVASTSFPVTLGLIQVRPARSGALSQIIWPGTSSDASSMLQVVATSAMTAAGLTFSLTIVALQLASQQFSPRLLRTFARDRLIQSVMALLISAFVVSLTTMRGLDPDRPLPVLALLLALVLGLLSGIGLLVFVGHMVRRLRIDALMAAVHGDTVATMEATYPPRRQGPALAEQDLPGPGGGVLLPAWDSGFVRATSPAAMVDVAAAGSALILLGVRPGDAVIRGTPVATAFAVDGATVDIDGLCQAIRPFVTLGNERTEEQDVGFGLRQLVDVAVKAVSPAINDPTTAGEAVSYCSDVLVRLLGRQLGPQSHCDAEGRVWVVAPDRDLRYYLDLTCAQLRRFGRDEPTVLAALLRLLRDCAVSARNDHDRAEIARQAELVVAAAPASLNEVDAAGLRDLDRRVSAALRREVAEAFADRAGETRSM
ncbi:MAG: DUF2254 domain-containing protein [Actinobacteria bacterium]|nr:DUF2254 domain-containing protein [Actinomycetota bacterium]MCA1722471.1 DUF2254 domain-containing protein [Actinomycetota bacterium]